MNKPASLDRSESFAARFTAAEFAQIYTGASNLDIRLELVHGHLERMTPPMGAHSTRQAAIVGHLWAALRERAVAEVGIALDVDTVLVCDAAILHHPMTEQRFLRPDEVMVAVEIAETTLDRDLGPKRLAYARAGIAYYWVIDGPHRLVHVFEQPANGDYAKVTRLPFGQRLTIPGTDQAIVIG